MSIYAYISIIDVFLKLVICYAVMVSPIDKLVFYAFLLLMVGVLDQGIYWFYCRRKFVECRIRLNFDKALFQQMFSFAGWNFIGSSAAILRSQGASLMLRSSWRTCGECSQWDCRLISGVVAQFVGNFTQAFNPQITKQYAAGEYDSLMRLLIYGYQVLLLPDVHFGTSCLLSCSFPD